jgi:hypothetical protein
MIDPSPFPSRAMQAIMDSGMRFWSLRLLLTAAFCTVLVAGGCSPAHFHAALEQPRDPVRFELTGDTVQEYWCGIVFNGEKIGFSHFRLAPSRDMPGRFDITSEAVFSLQFLMVEKRFSLRARDLVNTDLSLERFTYEYDLDGSEMRITGEMDGDTLKTTVHASGEILGQSFPGPVRPASVLYLYPAVQGLQTGRTYVYPVYDGETRSLSTVRQEVLACEESDLFEGKGFKVKTLMHGHEVIAWLDGAGRPLLEMALGGVMISGLESEDSAKRYLASATLNKDEALLEFSLIRANQALSAPRRLRYLELHLEGSEELGVVPSDERQRCEWRDGTLVCSIDASRDVPAYGCGASEQDRYLRSTLAVPAGSGRILGLAASIVQGTDEPLEAIRSILAWMDRNIEKKPTDVFTALDVLERGGAECQGHALLYAALCRAAGIPTRVVNGIVYSGEHQGFLYHTWAESCLGDAWISVDPTFSQIRVDATHLKVVEGENPAEIMPLAGMVGRVRARIVTFR